MTHLFNESDFHVGQTLTMVERRRATGEEINRRNVEVVSVKRGTTGRMKGKLKVGVMAAVDGRDCGWTVIPTEANICTTLEA